MQQAMLSSMSAADADAHIFMHQEVSARHAAGRYLVRRVIMLLPVAQLTTMNIWDDALSRLSDSTAKS